MKHEKLARALAKIYGLKHVVFGSFDSSSLGFALNRTHERVLMMTWHRQGVSMAFLSREAGLEKGSLTAVIDSLEAMGLVSRERDENDRRSFTITTTPAGALMAEQIEALFREHLSALLEKLSREDRLEFEKAAETFARLIPILAT